MKKMYMMVVAAALVMSGCATDTYKAYPSEAKDYMCKMVATYKKDKPTYLYVGAYDKKMTIIPMNRVIVHGKHTLHFMYSMGTKDGDIYTLGTARTIIIKGKGELGIMQTFDSDTSREKGFLFRCR